MTPQRGGIALLGYTFVLRGVVSPLLHPIFTSMTGLGVAYAASRPRGAASAKWAVFLGWLAAVALHGTWNGLSLFGTAGLIGGYLIMSAVLAGLIVVLYRDRRRLVGLILRYLPGYAYTGLVTGDDVAMLASLRARAQARTWARTAGGLPATAAMGDYQLAATELALARAKSVARRAHPRPFRHPRAEPARPHGDRAARVHPAHSVRHRGARPVGDGRLGSHPRRCLRRPVLNGNSRSNSRPNSNPAIFYRTDRCSAFRPPAKPGRRWADPGRGTPTAGRRAA